MNQELYMSRCIQLALKGKGQISPNPMVGAVVVYDNKIIGEGYHREYGKAHAEVNAINSVKDKRRLKESTLYVSLEPCAHYGKTPPCAQLIIDVGIPKVVIGCRDPFHKVAGNGIKMLEEARIEISLGVLEKECLELNKEFNTAQEKSRPYIYIKWAQSEDGFIDKDRDNQNQVPTSISNDFTKTLVHQLRSQVDAIMIGTNTAIADNPSLTTRLWHGHNPLRVILDRTQRIPTNYTLFRDNIPTIIFTENKVQNPKVNNIEYTSISFNENPIEIILNLLKNKGINSILIEGGAQLLTTIINHNLWDEAFIEVNKARFKSGIAAPHVTGNLIKAENWYDSKCLHFAINRI